MKRNTKTTAALLLALLLALGMQAMAFAAVNTERDAIADRSADELRALSVADEGTSLAAANEGTNRTLANEGTNRTLADEAVPIAAAEGNPETGASALPLIAVMLAAASVPVMVKTRKR